MESTRMSTQTQILWTQQNFDIIRVVCILNIGTYTHMINDSLFYPDAKTDPHSLDVYTGISISARRQIRSSTIW